MSFGIFLPDPEKGAAGSFFVARARREKNTKTGVFADLGYTSDKQE